MAAISKLLVELGLSPDKFNKGLDKAKGKLSSWGSTMTSVGQKATAGLTLPLIAAGALAVGQASDLVEAPPR